MRTLVLFKRSNEQRSCMVDHADEDAFNPEDEEILNNFRDLIDADDNSLICIEMPNDTFRPAIFDNEGQEVGMEFVEIKKGTFDADD